jgi:hypothetical protein
MPFFYKLTVGIIRVQQPRRQVHRAGGEREEYGDNVFTCTWENSGAHSYEKWGKGRNGDSGWGGGRYIIIFIS